VLRPPHGVALREAPRTTVGAPCTVDARSQAAGQQAAAVSMRFAEVAEHKAPTRLSPLAIRTAPERAVGRLAE
jgi:hypothetical protein